MTKKKAMSKKEFIGRMENPASALENNFKKKSPGTIRIKLPTIEQVTFTLEVEQDELSDLRGNALASGDDEVDKKYEDEIMARVDRGDVWAWASVCVRAEWRGMEGENYLYGCSYKDEADFKQPGGYYDDMKRDAYADLIEKLNALK